MSFRKRKVRSDKKFRWRKKNGKMSPYYPKRGRNDPIKIWFWEQLPMPKESIRRIPVGLRSTARKVIFKKCIRADVPIDRLRTKGNIEDLSIDIMQRPGDFYIMTFCKRKNKWGVSPVKACSIKIVETDQGLKARFQRNFRLFRYWFWLDGGKLAI